MELAQVKKDLKEIKAFYANVDVLSRFPEKAMLAEKYKTAVCTASSQLIAFFVYYYIQNNDLKTVSENMQLTERRVDDLSRSLKDFFCDNL